MDPFLQQLLAYQQQQQRQSQFQPQRKRQLRNPIFYNVDTPYSYHSPYGSDIPFRMSGYPRMKAPLSGDSLGGARRLPMSYYIPHAYPEDAENAYDYAYGYDDEENGGDEGEEIVEEDDGNDLGYFTEGKPNSSKATTNSTNDFATNPTINGDDVIYFTKPDDSKKSNVEFSDFPVDDLDLSSFFGNNKRQKAQQKQQQQQQQQPMYVMDRYGNLFPYKPLEKDTETNHYPKKRTTQNKKGIDANDLIRMLLGAPEVKNVDKKEDMSETKGNDEDSEELSKQIVQEIEKEVEAEMEAEAGAEAEAEAEEKLKKTTGEAESEADKGKESNETPLTREGLANILSQFTKAEAKETPPSTTTLPKVIRRSTVPCLNVHKVEQTQGSEGKEDKPVVVNDVKVSAPQLKKKNLPFSPPLNVYEFKSKYIVVISLPGVSKEFVEIDFHPTTNELIVKGEAKNKYLSDDDELANSFILKLSEQRFGNFERIVKLPAYPGIEDGEIKAKFLNGMLEIKLPKKDETKIVKPSKKIQLEDVPDEELERESSESYI